MAHARMEWALPSVCDWASVMKRGTRASLPLLEGCIDSATEVDTLSAVDANSDYTHERSIELEAVCAFSESEVGCFQSSKGFSQATPTCGASPRLILLPFGGIPNSPGFEENASGVPCGFESDRGTSTICGSEPSAKHDELRPFHHLPL